MDDFHSYWWICWISLFMLHIYGTDGHTTLNPTEVSVKENTTFRLNCTYSYTNPPPSTTCVWQIGENKFIGVVFSNCTSHSRYPELYHFDCKNKTFNSLTITHIQRAIHNTTFRCVYSVDGNDEPPSVTTVYVIVPLESVKMTKPVNDFLLTTENTTLTVSCITSAAYPHPNVVWFNDSRTPTDYSDDLVFTHELSTSHYSLGYPYSVTSDLTFNTTKFDNGIRIYCNASNSHELEISSDRKLLLDVQYPPSTPTFTMHLNSNLSVSKVSVIINSALLILCESTGNPKPRFSWTAPQMNKRIGQVLNITSIQTADDGTYQCLAQNVLTSGDDKTSYGANRSLEVAVLRPPDAPKLYFLQLGVPKEIITQPVNVVKGDNVSVLCNSTGKPHPTSFWVGYGASNDIVRLTATEANADITCYSTNVLNETGGNIQTHSEFRNLTFTVLYPPRNLTIEIQTQLMSNIQTSDNISILENSNFSLFCSAQSNPPSSYNWTSPVTSHIRTSSAQLPVYNIQRNQSGPFICHAFNVMSRSFGNNEHGMKTMSLHVDILYPPEQQKLYFFEDGISKEIKSLPVMVMVGDNVSVSCYSTGNPSPKSYWIGYSQSSNKLSLTSVVLDKNETCKSLNVMNESGGQIHIGSASQTLTIDVLYPPRNLSIGIQIQPGLKIETSDYISILENSNFSLVCSAQSNPPSSYNWTSPVTSQIWTSSTQLTPVYNIKRNQSGSFICHAFNVMSRSFGETEHGMNNRSLYIDILYKASVTIFGAHGSENKGSVDVNVTNEIQLICQVESNPYSNNTIQFKGRPVNETIGSNTVTYHLTYANCSDAGIYMCTGQNKYNHGNYSRKEFILYVKCLPQPSVEHLPEENVTAELLHPTSLEFTAERYYDPGLTHFTWYKQFLYKRILLQNDSNMYIYSSDVQSVLHFVAVTESDYGLYLLEYENSIGKNTFTFHLHQQERKAVESTMETSNSIVGMIAGVISGAIVMAVIVIVVGTVLYRNRSLLIRGKENETGRLLYQNIPFPGKESRNTLKTKKETSFHGLQELDDAPPLIREPVEYYNSPEKIERIDRIEVTELLAYVSARSEESFAVDYQKLPTGLEKPCTFARKPENIALNRYNGLYPYDHSRVKISGQPDFFINACYIDGFSRTNAYIASLGPTVKTTYDFKTFWMMVWNERSDIIAMLTNLAEPSGMKCEQYWPKLGTTISYGEIQVFCEREEVFAEYTMRILTISKAKHLRRVTQMHYTAWPDKKVPEDITTLVEFRERLKGTRSSKKGPIIVHCSAGIGRTGTLIALDRLIEEGQCDLSVDVFKCVNSMREQRVKMVQTVEQYIYIYKALVNSLYFDCEMILQESFQEYVNVTNNNIYSQQFQQLKESVETCSKEESEARARNEKLVNKNHEGADIPGSQHRVYLYLNRKMDDTDYINAVYVNSFKKKNHFIIAQSPLPDTVADFICMIYQEGCCCVITMEDLKEPGMSVGKFLPTDGRALRYGDMKISCTTLETKPQFTVREMRIKTSGKHECGEKLVYHFQYHKWMPGNDTPADAKEFVQFVKDVEDYTDQLGDQTSHVLVHCLKGNERSALYCVVTILMEKMRYERQVSVLNTVRHLRTRRRSAITSMEQLKFCYQAVSAYIGLFEP